MGNLLDISLGNHFLDMEPKAQATTAKINKWDYIILKLHSKGNGQQNEKTTYGIGKNICESCI